MKKFTYAWWCYGATLAVLWLIAILPISSWTLKNHIDILSGGWGDQPGGMEHELMPNRIVGSDYRPGDISMPIPAWVRGARYPRRFDYSSVRDYAHAHPDDPAALAQLVRFQFLAGITFRPSDEPTAAWQGASLNQARAEGLWAADRGAQIDPDNGFFWISRSVLQNWKGLHREAMASLARAASAGTYRDFVLEEEQTRYQDLLSRVGYRGEKAHDALLGKVLLPHLATYKHFAKDVGLFPDSRDGIQAKADILRFASLMQRKDTSLVGVLVASSLVAIILEPAVDPENPPAVHSTPPDLTPLALSFYEKELSQKIARPFDPRLLARSVEKVRGSVDFSVYEHDPLDELFSNRATSLAPSLLVGLILSILIAAITFRMPAGWAVSGRRLLPFVAAWSAYWIALHLCQRDAMWSPAFPTFYWGIATPITLDNSAVSLMIWLAVPALLQFIPATRKLGMILGGIGAAIWIVFVYPDIYSCAPAAAFFLGIGLSKVRRPVPPGIIGFGLIAVCWAVGSLAVYLALPRTTDSGLSVSLMVVLLIGIIFVSAGSKKVLQVAPFVSLLLAGGYLFAVANEMRDNQTIKAALDSYQHEADVTRAKAGIS